MPRRASRDASSRCGPRSNTSQEHRLFKHTVAASEAAVKWVEKALLGDERLQEQDGIRGVDLIVTRTASREYQLEQKSRGYVSSDSSWTHGDQASYCVTGRSRLGPDLDLLLTEYVRSKEGSSGIAVRRFGKKSVETDQDGRPAGALVTWSTVHKIVSGPLGELARAHIEAGVAALGGLSATWTHEKVTTDKIFETDYEEGPIMSEICWILQVRLDVSYKEEAGLLRAVKKRRQN